MSGAQDRGSELSRYNGQQRPDAPTAAEHGLQTLSPVFLEPRRTAEKALIAVIQEAYVQGISTRHTARRAKEQR